MTDKDKEIKKIATRVLAGMLSNPHIYAMVSDEEGRGQQEQILVSTAINIAELLLEKVEGPSSN